MADPTTISVFCPDCLRPFEAKTLDDRCRTCDVTLKPLFDETGALTRDYLLCQGYCCDSGCANCPYPKNDAKKSPGAE